MFPENGGRMKLIVGLLMLLVSVAAAAQPRSLSSKRVGTQTAEREVLAAVTRFFSAVHDRDRAAMTGAVLPEGLASAIRVGQGPQPLMRSWHWPTYIENQLAGPQTFTERLFDPEVRIDGDIAMVWARYELLVNEQFDHCGFDHFDLVRRNGKWLVYNLTWTNQKADCAGG
jgi:hypothetical protein